MVYLKILTFNIWFARHEMSKRMEAIGTIIADGSPDVVAFQEMTDAHWKLCLPHPAVRSYYWSEPPPGQRYYTMLGSRSPFVVPPARLPFSSSNMGRDLLYASIQPYASKLPPVVVGTSHLESLDSPVQRRQQIEESLRVLEEHAGRDLIFCGDTNIDERVDGKVSLPEGWQDAWSFLKPQDPGFTFDVRKNSMMARADDWARRNLLQVRYDRFWMKLAQYNATAIKMEGDKPLESTDIWPSDHFGLLLTLSPPGAPSTCEDTTCTSEPPIADTSELEDFIDSAKHFKWGTAFEILGRHPEYVNMRPDARIFAAIHQAAFAGDVAVLRRFIEEFGADPALLSRNGKTPEQVALDEGHSDAAEYLASFV